MRIDLARPTAQRVVAAGLAAALVAVSLACTGTGPSPGDEAPQSVVIVAIDTLRRDHLSCYGFPHPISPNIDRLAGEGTRFTNAVTTAPWTLPSFASLFSGQYPSAHGAGERTGPQGESGEPPKSPIRPQVAVLPELLGAAGYLTASFFDNPYLGDTWGLSRGFGNSRRSESGGAESVDAALAWLAEHEGEPTFVLLHLMEPHLPYEPPEPYAGQARSWFPGAAPTADRPAAVHGDNMRALYAGEVAYSDHLVGRFVDGLRDMGRLDDSLLVLLSDHGEEFWEHAEIERRLYNDPRELWGIGHGHSQFEELIAMPLIVRFPGRVPAGTQVDALVQMHDLAPSILEWAGLEVPPEMTGVSLLPALAGETPRDHAFSEFILYGDDRRSYREGTLKAIMGPTLETSELYDLAVDPGETVNLRDERPDDFRRLARRLLAVEARAAELGRAQGGDHDPVSIDQETLDELRALGYIQ